MKSILSIWSVALLSACGSESMSPEAYATWVEEAGNGLCLVQQVNGIEYKVQYAPHEYLALMNNRRTGLTRQSLREELEDYSGSEYFVVSIRNTNPATSANNTVGQKWYEPVQDYLQFDMQRDLKLIANNDTLQCAAFHFEGENHLKQQLNFMVAFECDMPGSKNLVFTDRAFSNQQLFFAFDTKTVESIPKLRI